MRAALEEPRRVAGFLKSFKGLGEGWELQVSRPSPPKHLIEESKKVGEALEAQQSYNKAEANSV